MQFKVGDKVRWYNWTADCKRVYEVVKVNTYTNDIYIKDTETGEELSFPCDPEDFTPHKLNNIERIKKREAKVCSN
jgi:hypothetical protein